MNTPRPKGSETSATLAPTLWLMAGCFGLLVVGLQARPAWWNARGAVNSSATTNNYAMVNQGQLKQFTARAVDELNADYTSNGGAGSTLSNLVYNWHQDYATNHYSTNAIPYKPSDFNAVNVGQLKYIGKQVWSRLVTVGYTNALPSWLNTTNAGDGLAANIGELKTVFNFDLSGAPAPVTNLVATASVGEIDLTWTLPGTNTAASLLVQQSTDGGVTWTTVQTLSPTATSYVAAGLSTGTSYSFRIESILNAFVAASLATTSAQTLPSVLAAPTGLGGSYNTYQTMSLWWTASTGASSYVIERENLATGVWSVVGTASGMTYTDTNDPAYLGVHYRVHAVGGTGQSGPSGEYPTLRYAVIDLGTNNFPVAFNNAGSVVLQMGTNTYNYSYNDYDPYGGPISRTGTAYPYGYWTNGAVASTIPLATIGGMNNRGDVVGVGTNNLTLYCSGNYTFDLQASNTVAIPIAYFPTYKWNSGTLTRVGPVPTQHVAPPVYNSQAGASLPLNPITPTQQQPNLTTRSSDDLQAVPVGITDSGSTYGTMSEGYYYNYIGVYGGSASYFGILDSGTPPASVTVENFNNSTSGIYSSLTGVNANGQAIGGYNTNGTVLPTTWVAFDGTSYHTLNGIPQYIANNNNIVGTDSTYTNTLLFTNAAPNGILLTNAPCGSINSSNQIVGYNMIWETNVVTKLADVVASTNWDFSPAIHYNSWYHNNYSYSASQVNDNNAINDNGAIVGSLYPVDADGNQLYDANGNLIRKGAMLLPITMTPSTIPTSGVARAKIVFGGGFHVPVIPQSNTAFAITIGGQNVTDIHQDDNNPNILYFAVPPGPAGLADVAISGITVPGLPWLSSTPPQTMTLPKLVQYTGDPVKGINGFSASNVVSIDEDKSTIDYQVQQGGITSVQAPDIFSEMRADLASTQCPLFDQFFSNQAVDAGALATLQQQAQAELTIFDTAYPPPNTGSNASTGVSIFASIPSGYETGPASGLFTVTRPAAATSSLTVNYTIAGTATNGTDYTTLSGSIVIPANQTSAQITVAPIQHALGANRTVVLTLSSSVNYAINSNYSADTVTIYDYGNGVTSNTTWTKSMSLVALDSLPKSESSNPFLSHFFIGGRHMAINSDAIFALLLGQTTPPPLPQLGSSTFFADVKSRLTATGAGIFYVHNISVATGIVPIHCYVLNADNYHLSTYQASAVGNIINQAVADNPTASVIVNGAQFSYHCGDPSLKTWARSWFQTSAPAEPFSTMGVVIHSGSTLSTSTNSSKGSWLTAIARYWVGESTAANNGVAASYLFGHGTPTASATPEAMGGLTSLLWQNIAQTPTGTPGAIHTDKDLGAYTSLGHGILTGFNIIGVNYASGMVIILNKDNGVPGNLLDFQAPLIASGVDYAELTDGSASVGCWSKTEGYVSLGARQKQPIDQVNTVTGYLIFSHN